MRAFLKFGLLKACLELFAGLSVARYLRYLQLRAYARVPLLLISETAAV